MTANDDDDDDNADGVGSGIDNIAASRSIAGDIRSRLKTVDRPDSAGYNAPVLEFAPVSIHPPALSLELRQLSRGPAHLRY